MVKKLVMRLLAYLFPIRNMGSVEISHEQMTRKSIAATERFWGGRAPVVISWSGDEPEHIFSDNLQRRKEKGEKIPHPIRVIG